MTSTTVTTAHKPRSRPPGVDADYSGEQQRNRDAAADLDQLRDLAIENGQTAAGVAAVMGAAKILGFITDRQQIEAVVHRPAPRPDMEKGLILSEAEWEQQVRRP